MRDLFAALALAPVMLLASNASEAEDVNIGGFIIPGSIAAGLFYDYEERLVEESDGVLEPNLLIHGEGGPEEQILTGIRRGRIHVASLSTLVLSNIVPELTYLSAPFLFDSKDQFDHVVDTQFIEIFAPLLEERDLTILRWLDLGGQNIYANKPILWPRDAVGVRLRSTQDLASRLFLESVGVRRDLHHQSGNHPRVTDRIDRRRADPDRGLRGHRPGCPTRPITCSPSTFIWVGFSSPTPAGSNGCRKT